MNDDHEGTRWIPIAHGWVMSADPHNFTIGKAGLSKKGTPIVTRRRYYGTVESAIAAVMTEVVRDDVSSGDITDLQGIVDRVDEFHALLTRIFKLRISA